jgi:Protein of unknown function (DUF429)
LSVSSDRIAVCAWRCAHLLRLYSERTGWTLDRVGVTGPSGMDGPPDPPRPSGLVAEAGVVEVYPAGALAMWGLRHKGYKRDGSTGPGGALKGRREIMASLEATGDSWLIVSDDVRAACEASDDALDALISSLVTCHRRDDQAARRATRQRATRRLDPSPDSLTSLAPGAV